MSRMHLFEGVCRWFAPFACGRGYLELCVGLLRPMPACIWLYPICVSAYFSFQSPVRIWPVNYSHNITAGASQGCLRILSRLDASTPRQRTVPLTWAPLAAASRPLRPPPTSEAPSPQTRHPTLAVIFNLSPPILVSEIAMMPDAPPST